MAPLLGQVPPCNIDFPLGCSTGTGFPPRVRVKPARVRVRVVKVVTRPDPWTRGETREYNGCPNVSFKNCDTLYIGQSQVNFSRYTHRRIIQACDTSSLEVRMYIHVLRD